MPHARCPVCQANQHFSVRGSAIAQWYREHGRRRAVDGTPLLLCLRCCVDLKPGHEVTIRSLPDGREDLAVSQRGIVESVMRNDTADCAVQVRFGPITATFRRDDLFYAVGQASDA